MSKAKQIRVSSGHLIILGLAFLGALSLVTSTGRGFLREGLLSLIPEAKKSSASPEFAAVVYEPRTDERRRQGAWVWVENSVEKLFRRLHPDFEILEVQKLMSPSAYLAIVKYKVPWGEERWAKLMFIRGEKFWELKHRQDSDQPFTHPGREPALLPTRIAQTGGGHGS